MTKRQSYPDFDQLIIVQAIEKARAGEHSLLDSFVIFRD